MDNSIEKLFQQDNSQKRVLQYVREPKLSGQLFRNYGENIAKNYLKIATLDRISEIDQNVTHYIKVDKYNYYDFTTEDFLIFDQVIDLPLIIRNDRVFRYELPYYQAIELVYGCTKYYIELFKNNRYDILLTHIIDEFVVDILVRVARYFNVQVVGYCANSYDSKYMQITIRGEYMKVREPAESEVTSFLILLTEKTSKPYVKPRNTVYKSIAKYYLIYKIKFLYHYLLRYKLLNDKGYRYMMTRADTYPRNLKDIFLASSYFYASIAQLPLLDKNLSVYVPLHYHPEATTDYWIKDSNYLTYYPSLIKVLRSYSDRGFTVLVKEHTASYMQRDIKLYEAISKIPLVYLISPFITTYEVLEFVEYVVVWTGTTGVEAIMQNKKVILAAGETYYSFNKLSKIGEEDSATIPTDEEKRTLARHILSSFLPII